MPKKRRGMALKSLIRVFAFFLLCFSLVTGIELKQDKDKAEKPFALKCADGEYVSVFAGNFTRNGTDHRRYGIQCRKLRVGGQSKCSSSNETELMKYFDDIGCGNDQYLGGIESTKFKDGDRKFRLICCHANGLVVSESDCRNVETSTQQNFTQKLADGEVIHKVSSRFNLWQSDNKFVVDRRWLLTICKFSKTKAPDADSDNGKETSDAGGPANAQKPPAPLNVTLSCETNADGFSTSEPPSGPETTEPGTNTPAFKRFTVNCPNGYAIRSIRVVAKRDYVDARQKDTAFSVKCDKLPLADDVTACPVKRKEIAFREDNDIREMSSLQSPCDPTTGQFLCGLSGSYFVSRRRLSAICCTIKNVFPSMDVEPVLADPTDEGFAEVKGYSKKQYVGNLDQLPGGVYVGHMTLFTVVYEQKGKMEPTSKGCRCRCPCKCQKEDQSQLPPQPLSKQQQHHHLRQKVSAGETHRHRRSKADCDGAECTCKCVSPCEK